MIGKFIVTLLLLYPNFSAFKAYCPSPEEYIRFAVRMWEVGALSVLDPIPKHQSLYR